MNQSSEWFVDWFNSPFYSVLYSHRTTDEAKLFVDLVEKNIYPSLNWKFLDFCCGNGRLSLELAKRGYSVTGIDLSDKLINLAIGKAEQQNLIVDFHKCDIRCFETSEQYDAVINFFTSFGYFHEDENKRVFNRMSNSIKDSGWLILDYLNKDFVEMNLSQYDEKYIDDKKVVLNREIKKNRVMKQITIESEGKTYNYLESVQLYTLEEFEDLFHSNNLKVIKIFGDYLGSTFSKTSPRMIFFAKK